MPIYEYECTKCGKKFEVWQKITEPPLETCPECGGKLIKLISQTSFILKGTGWYVTDYARKEKQQQDKKETKKEASKKEDTKKSSKKETKTK